MSYEPKIEVVREIWSHYGASAWGTSQDGPGERAYLVRGLPMPGERVQTRHYRAPSMVSGMKPMIEVSHAPNNGGGLFFADEIRPYDPDAERLRVATEAVRRVVDELWDEVPLHEDVARAVLEALKEVEG